MALDNLESLRPFLPENVLVAGILVLLVTGLFGRRGAPRLAAALALATCGAALLATAVTADGQPRGLFGGLVARDPFADFFKYVTLVATAAVVLVALRARDTVDHARGGEGSHEFHALVLAAALGIHLMAAATDLLVVYLALEFVSLVSYILAGFTPGSRRSAEAALKYVIYGGVASGAMLYGLSLLYGLAASTELGAVRAAAAGAPPLVVVVAVVLCMAGLGYKIAVVPFHMWCPDVYEGAPTPVTAFLSVAPKAGGFALVLRFFTDAVPHEIGGRSPWVLFLLVIAAATMTLGNLAALHQRGLKRLLAYSSIAHAGYALLGVAAGTPAGHQAVLFYLGVYLFMNLAAFAVVAAVAEATGGETLDDYAGLGYRMPLAGLVMTVALLSLVGLPPTAGFVGKYYLFAALVERGRDGGGVFYVVAAVAVANSVLSLGYYARILRAMYLARADEARARVAAAAPHRVALAALALPVLVLGVYWSPLRDLVEASLALWTG